MRYTTLLLIIFIFKIIYYLKNYLNFLYFKIQILTSSIKLGWRNDQFSKLVDLNEFYNFIFDNFSHEFI